MFGAIAGGHVDACGPMIKSARRQNMQHGRNTVVVTDTTLLMAVLL